MKTAQGKAALQVEFSKRIEVEEGNSLKLKGTIKDHSEYNNQKQTVLTRCKVLA